MAGACAFLHLSLVTCPFDYWLFGQWGRRAGLEWMQRSRVAFCSEPQASAAECQGRPGHAGVCDGQTAPWGGAGDGVMCTGKQVALMWPL